MEILIAVSGAIAFLALIVYLWNSERAGAYSRTQPPSAAASREPSQNPSGSSDAPLDSWGSVEEKSAAPTPEPSELLNKVEQYPRNESATESALHQVQARFTETTQRLAALEGEAASWKSRFNELSIERSRSDDEITGLRQELKRLSGIERQAAILAEEKAECLGQLQRLRSEHEVSAQRVLALGALEAEIAALREENGRLRNQIAELQASLRDQLKMQIDGLQELYRTLQSQMN